jgi:CRP-like cAMP-binding protein
VLRKNAKIDLLKSVPLFEQCSRRELDEISQVADEVSLDAGTMLTQEGATGQEFVIIVEGAADVLRRGRLVNRLGSGDFLGEIALVSRLPRTATVRTTAPTRALVIAAPAFRTLLRRTPSMQMKVLEALAARLPDDLG